MQLLERIRQLYVKNLYLGSTPTQVTATGSEINALAGTGVVAADVTKLHAITASAAEVNALTGQGVTTADAAKLHAITAAAADVNLLAGMVAASQGVVKVAKVTLTGNTIHAGVVAWVNPEAVSIIINRLIVDVTTVASAAATLSSGTTATNATTASANLIDTLDVRSATGVFGNISEGGTLGKQQQKLASAKWVTFAEASGNTSGLVGNAYIFYTLI